MVIIQIYEQLATTTSTCTLPFFSKYMILLQLTNKRPRKLQTEIDKFRTNFFFRVRSPPLRDFLS